MSGSGTAHRSDPMSCDELEQIAPELALGTLDDDTRAEASKHIDACNDCRTEVARLREVTASLLLLAPEASPPAGFEGRVLDRIARLDGIGHTSSPAPSQTATRVPTGRRSKQGPQRRRVVAAAAALIVLAGLAMTAWAVFSPNGEPSSLATAEMRTDGGDIVGEVVLYDDETPALQLDLAGWREGWERYGGDRDTDWLLTVEGRDGQHNSYVVTLDDWTAEVSLGDVDAADVVAVAMVDAHDGRTWCSGSFA